MPSSSWQELAKRYSEFAALPAWWAAGDIRPAAEDRPTTQAALDATIRTLQNRFPDCWPRSPLQLDQQHVRLLFPKPNARTDIRNPRRNTRLGQLWTALLLDRSDFACCWCGQSAFETFEREGRSLRLELDHQTPRARGGATLSLGNIRAACRSCNTLRGRLTPDRVRAELLSIARAVLKAEGVPSA